MKIQRCIQDPSNLVADTDAFAASAENETVLIQCKPTSKNALVKLVEHGHFDREYQIQETVCPSI